MNYTIEMRWKGVAVLKGECTAVAAYTLATSAAENFDGEAVKTYEVPHLMCIVEMRSGETFTCRIADSTGDCETVIRKK